MGDVVAVSHPSPIDGTPRAGDRPFIVIGFAAIRETLVVKRRMLGWSQAFLASQCPDPSGGSPMHHNTVYKFEKHGWRGPQDLTVAARLADAMGIELSLAVRERSTVLPTHGKLSKLPASVAGDAVLESAHPRVAERAAEASTDPDLEF